MPRYFMHIEQHGDIVEDPDGAEFPTLEAARLEAIAAARQMMSERVAKGEPADGSMFNIVDTEGHTVLRVAFKDALRSE